MKKDVFNYYALFVIITSILIVVYLWIKFFTFVIFLPSVSFSQLFVHLGWATFSFICITFITAFLSLFIKKLK